MRRLTPLRGLLVLGACAALLPICTGQWAWVLEAAGDNARRIWGRAVSSSAPENGDGLIWDGATSEWKPTAVAGGHTQNTDTGTTATCFALDTDAATPGPKLCHDSAGGWELRDASDNVLLAKPLSGELIIGDGTTALTFGGFTCTSLAEPAASNKFTFCVDRTTGLPTWKVYGGSQAYAMVNPMTAAGDLILGGASGAAGRLAKGDDTQVLTMVSGTPAWAAGGSGASATPDTVLLREEFLSGSTTSNQVGALGWSAGGTIAGLAGSTIHPGMYRFTTSSAANGTAYTLFTGGSYVQPFDELEVGGNWESYFTFKTHSETTELKYRIGFAFLTAATEAAPTYAMELRYSNSTGCTSNDSDATWIYETRNSTATTQAGPAFAASTWYTLRIRSTSAGHILFSMKEMGGAYSSEVDITTNLTTGPLTPMFAVTSCNTTQKYVDVDYWGFKQTGLTR